MGEVKLKEEYTIGEWVDNGYNRFRIVLNKWYDPEKDDNKKMSFCFYDYLTLTYSMRTFSVSPIDKDASIASIIMTGHDRLKVSDFLNTLMQEYITRGLEKKNLVSENTINFIDGQLLEIQDSLNQAEIDLQNFRRNNDLMDMDAQAKQVFEYVKSMEEQRAVIAVNEKYYKRLQDYIKEHLNDPENLVAPSAMGIQDPLLNQLVVDLVRLSREKSTQLLTSTELHPSIIMIDEQIVNTKKTLLENINNLVANAELSLDDIDQRIAKAQSESKDLPQTKRLLLGYQRKFDYSDETFNYLMQRRSEAQILKASNTADNEIIDLTSFEQTVKTAPNLKKVYLIAMFLGLLFPALYILIKDFFNVKIRERKDIEKLTKYPIIGQIALSTNSSPLVVVDSPKSSIAESFRSVRTNIGYILQGKPHCSILITGDMQSVGKTFTSMNIASIYALYGKKTVLLGFDLRKPKIYQEFNLPNRVGISDYLSNKNSLDEIIQVSGKIPSLDIITAGPIPPNPAELIASEKCDEFFRELRERYDYIIIDTPPLGLVTDAFLLMKYSDANVYVVRQDYTNKNVFASVIKDLEDRNVPVNIVINGIRFEGAYGYRYSTGYGDYGYGHYRSYGESYYGDDDENGGKKRRRPRHNPSN
jgi:capsular exopolysaccharide family